MGFVGNADNRVSEYLKAWIKPTGSDSGVVGLIGPGTSRQLQSNWNSPFEQSSVGSAYEKTAGLVQQMTGLTSVSHINGEQIWDGNRPESANLVLIFYALTDPVKEVMQALAALESMASPQVKALAPGGRIPQTVTLNIGRVSLFTEMVIESIPSPLDGPKDSEGRLLKAEVNITLQTKNMYNASDIPRTWRV
ncbi:MAG TPA: hypothetical protein DCS05_02080 [Nitrospiraceae bacterium]|nr:hypothetical protein [Nitrospiraceae bacterium]